MFARISLTLACFCATSLVHARLEVDALFTDHMVLQQQMPVNVWGKASPNTKIVVRFAGQVHETVTNPQGEWILKLEPMQASKTPRVLRVEGDGSQRSFGDVLVGEVWVGSGQSNMAYAMSQTEDGRVDLANANQTLIRVFKRPQGQRTHASWHLCSPEILQDFSAVGYYFAKNMQVETGVPIGIVVRSVGGTTIQRWTPSEASTNNKYIQSQMEQARLHSKEFGRLEEEKRKYSKTNPPSSETAAWLQKMSRLSYYRGQGYGGLYERMIRPLQPMTIRGVIWYQGEFNNRGGQAYDYREWQACLVDSWRKDWGQGDFPFAFVQMQVLGNATTTLLRESQSTTLKRCDNTAMAVICDQSAGLHPPKKRVAGERLGQVARNLMSRDEKVGSGPALQTMRQDQNQLVLKFEDVGEGLVVKGGQLKGFFICGEDREFVLAQARLVNPREIRVWSDKVAKPIAARYAWLNDPRDYMPIYDSDGLPASPFRTDKFKDTSSLTHLLDLPQRSRKSKRGQASRSK